MKAKPSLSLFASTAIVLCTQMAVFTPVMAQDMPVTYSAADLHRFYSAIDVGDVRGAQNYIDTVQAVLASSPSTQGYRVDMNFRDDAGNTPLIRAARQRNPEMIKFLLDNGANINAENSKWETALIVSYNEGNFGISRYLISMGATDTYNIAGKLGTIESRVAADRAAAAPGMSATTKAGLIAGGAALAIGGGIAAASSGSGGGGSRGAGGPAPITGSASIDCGSGSGINPEDCVASDFNTAEARNQEGVLNMNAHFAYASGYDGSIYERDVAGNLIDDVADGFVRVAVMDSGVNLGHTDLDSNVLAGLSVTCDNTGCVSGGYDTTGHGTNVAGVIAAERNGVGMHGVAPNAKFFSIGFADQNGMLTYGDVSGLRHAVTNGAQIINNSYGLTQPIVAALNGNNSPVSGISPNDLATYMTTTIAGSNYTIEYQNAVDNHVLLVFAAGNSAETQSDVLAGLPVYFQGAFAPTGISQPDYETVNPDGLDWSKNWVSVVSVDDDNNISNFSSQCGMAMNWCIAAPGELTASTSMNGGYDNNILGTSFAAPNVTGSLAVLLGAFPQLTPEEALTILFDTATDLGDTGIDEVYGHGLVNLRAATNPSIGGWTLSTSGSSNNFSFDHSGFNLSAPFGNALNQNRSFLMFQDKYKKDYRVPLSVVAGDLTQNKTAYDKFAQFATTAYDSVMNIGEHSKMAFSSTSNAPQAGYMLNRATPENARPGETKLAKFSFQSAMPMGATDKALFGFNYKTDLNDAISDRSTRRLLTSDALKNPYLSLTDEANSSVLGFESGRRKVTLVSYQAKLDNEYNYRYDNRKNVSGFYGEYNYTSRDRKTQLGASQGVSVEQNSLLGSESSGAFGIDKSTTYHAGLTGRYELADNMALLANYHMGMTKVNEASSSLFTGFDNIMTSAFALGAEFSNVHRDEDKLGFMVSQPLHVNSGSAGLNLPTHVASNGSVLYSKQKLNLAPSARELDLESYYGVKLSEKSELSLNAILRLNPNNDSDADNEAAMFGKYKYSF